MIQSDGLPVSISKSQMNGSLLNHFIVQPQLCGFSSRKWLIISAEILLSGHVLIIFSRDQKPFFVCFKGKECVLPTTTGLILRDLLDMFHQCLKRTADSTMCRNEAIRGQTRECVRQGEGACSLWNIQHQCETVRLNSAQEPSLWNASENWGPSIRGTDCLSLPRTGGFLECRHFKAKTAALLNGLGTLVL